MPAAPVPPPTPAPAPIAQQASAAPAAQGGTNWGLMLGVLVLVLLVAGGAYAYYMYYLPMAAAPQQNSLVAEQAPQQDEVSAIETELGAESSASFDSEMQNLENSF